jgi:hypothetical protein
MPLNVLGGPLSFEASLDDQQFQKIIDKIESELRGLTNTAEKEARSIDNLVRKTTSAIAAYASVATASNFIGDIARVRGEFQQLEVAFTTMLGSKQKADQLLAEVTRFAATTPFELQDVAKATKQLLAFGISAEKIEPTLRSLGDVSAGIGAPLGEIAYLFGTIKTQGVALTQDVRQFAQRGIPIYEELAKVLHVSVEEVSNFITAGKVGFPEVEKVFQNLTAAGSKFGGLMAEQAKTLTGQISNFQDAWNQMLNSLGKDSEGIFSEIIKGSTFAVEHFRDVIDIIELLIITYGSYRAAVIATSAVQAIQTSITKGYTIAETLRYQAMLLSDRVMKVLNATMLANPTAIVIAGFAALVSALVLFSKKATEAKSKSELLSEANKKIGDSLSETESKIRPYLEQLQKANLSEQERLDIYNKLKAIDPDIIKGLTAKTLTYEALAANVNLYLDALRKQIALEANGNALRESIKQEQEIQKQIDQIKKDLKEAGTENADAAASAFGFETSAETLKRLTKDLEEQKKTSAELGQTQVESEKKNQEEKRGPLLLLMKK